MPAGKFYRLRQGRDAFPEIINAAEEQLLNDPLATLLLRRGDFPLTLKELDAAVAADGTLSHRFSFVVAEGGAISFNEAPTLRRGFRFVIAYGRQEGAADLFVSTAAPFDSRDQFLQVLGWDSAAAAFQFYERRNGSWFWAGSSWDALEEDMRGKGPFDSHVNGSMVMKELRAPWLHWSSQSHTIPAETMAPDDPLAADPSFTGAKGGETLEKLVVEGIDRWTGARLARVVKADGEIAQPNRLMRHLLTTTTINIACSPDTSAGPPGALLRIPRSFFFNTRCLLDLIGLQPQVERPQVSRERYLASARRLGLHLADPLQGFRREGDVLFAWAVPEPAFEDINVLAHLLRRGILSKRFAGALLMVDFPNPVGSKAREALMRHVPAEVAAGGPGLENVMAEALKVAAANDPSSPEAEFLLHWGTDDATWREAAAGRIGTFMTAVAERLADDAGLDDLMLLAESRRREFRRRPLSEFGLTLPRLDAVAQDPPILRLEADGRVIASTLIS